MSDVDACRKEKVDFDGLLDGLNAEKIISAISLLVACQGLQGHSQISSLEKQQAMIMPYCKYVPA